MANDDEVNKALQSMVMVEVGPDELSESDYDEDDSDGRDDVDEDEEGGDDWSLQQQQPPKKLKRGEALDAEDAAPSYDVPTAEEQIALKSADELLFSSGNQLLSLQVEELLAETRLGRGGAGGAGSGGRRRSDPLEDIGSLREWLFRFRDLVLGMAPRPLSTSSSSSSSSSSSLVEFPALRRCLSAHSRLHPVELAFEPPARCDVVGSLMVGTLSRPDR